MNPEQLGVGWFDQADRGKGGVEDFLVGAVIEWQQEIENRLAAYDRGEMPSYSREAAMRILDQDASQ